MEWGLGDGENAFPNPDPASRTEMGVGVGGWGVTTPQPYSLVLPRDPESLPLPGILHPGDLLPGTALARSWLLLPGS